MATDMLNLNFLVNLHIISLKVVHIAIESYTLKFDTFLDKNCQQLPYSETYQLTFLYCNLQVQYGDDFLSC